MGLQSLQYCAFLVVVAAVYLHLPVRMQPVFLLGASWVFYALAMPAMLPVTIALAVFTYLCGRGLAWRGGAHKTAFLRFGVIGMLGILAFFKYNGLLGGVLHGWRAVAMPLATGKPWPSEPVDTSTYGFARLHECMPKRPKLVAYSL